MNSCTKGLWIWNKPLICKRPDGSEVQLLIIDTEGLGSLDADAVQNAQYFLKRLYVAVY